MDRRVEEAGYMLLVTERKPPLSELVTGYVRVFGHSLRGRVCPDEIEYGKRAPILQAQELSDVTGFCRAFGLEASSSIIERWDHIAVELEFVELCRPRKPARSKSGRTRCSRSPGTPSSSSSASTSASSASPWAGPWNRRIRRDSTAASADRPLVRVSVKIVDATRVRRSAKES